MGWAKVSGTQLGNWATGQLWCTDGAGGTGEGRLAAEAAVLRRQGTGSEEQQGSRPALPPLLSRLAPPPSAAGAAGPGAAWAAASGRAVHSAGRGAPRAGHGACCELCLGMGKGPQAPNGRALGWGRSW